MKITNLVENALYMYIKHVHICKSAASGVHVYVQVQYRRKIQESNVHKQQNEAANNTNNIGSGLTSNTGQFMGISTPWLSDHHFKSFS